MNSSAMDVIDLGKWVSDIKEPFPELYLVGGVIRDLLLGRMCKDIDLVCKDAGMFARLLAKGRNVAVIPMEKKPDAPTFRVVDRNFPSRVLDIAEMRGATILEDLRCRDFTINAIAMQIGKNGQPGDIIDPVNGRGDIRKKIIRCVRKDVFESDPLRILRAYRLAAQLGFVIEPATQEKMQAGVLLLARISVERIVSELLLILEQSVAAEVIRTMDETGILEVIFPEIGPMKGCPQNTYHHKDVWGHSLLVIKHCEYILNHLPEYFEENHRAISDNLGGHNRLSLLKLAALLHDVGKPPTRGLNHETGRITFYGHDEAGAAMMAVITERLKMAKRDREFLGLLLSEHLHVLSLSAPDVRPRTLMRWFRKFGDDVIPIFILGMADIQSALGPASRADVMAAHLDWFRRATLQYYDKAQPQLARSSLISGNDLVDMGIKPGPEIGRLLERIREAQDMGEVADKADALSLARRILNS